MPDTPTDQSDAPSSEPSAPAAAAPNSLATQLVLLVATVVVVTVGSVSLLATYRIEQAVFARETVRFQAENDRLASELSSYVARVRGDVLGILHVGAAERFLRARDMGADEAQAAAREALASLFEADLLARPSHLQVRLIDVRGEGMELIRLDRSGPAGSIRVVPPEALQHKSDRDYVKSAAALGAGELYISPVDLNRERGVVEQPLTPVLRAATPVFSDDGEVAAVLAVNVDMRPALAQIVPSFEQGRIFLLADSGDFLVHPDPERTFGSVLGREAWWRRDFGRLAETIDENATVPLQYTYNRRPMVLVGTSLRIADGSRAFLMQSVPESAIVAPARRARRVTAFAGVIAVLFASVVSWLAARSLTRPITQMTTAVTHFRGTGEVDVPVTARGEIGVLASAFQAMARDIVERSERERLYMAVVESSDDAILATDLSGRIVAWNPASERLFGFAQHEALDRSIDELIPPPPDEKATMLLAGPDEGGEIARYESSRYHRDGRLIPVSVTESPIRTPSGDVIGLSKIVRDITANRLAALRLQSYATRLERSNADLENFAYVTSHDLKAPLRGIASVATWLAEDLHDVINDDQRENLGLMLERTERLNNLIDGILEYSRVGRSDLELGPADAAQIVDDVIAAMALPEGISIRIDGELPTVVFDETQLRQVFQNLIDNAIKHIGKPSGEIIVSVERGEECWCFEVRDTGVGIQERHFERIFLLFHTLRPKDEVHATGLGLAIVKRIVENRGGSVTVSSTIGEGTSFRFSVPDAVNGHDQADDEGSV